MRRDLINAEISNLRDLLPLPPSTRQRLSQLQLMALVCVYVRKINYFQQVFKSHDFSYQYQEQATPTPNIGFSKAMNGFIMMMTQNGKLLYISENAAEYLGHSMEDLLIHGDSVYDIIDKQDHLMVQVQLNRNGNETENVPKNTHFFCRMNVSRNARRQMRFGDQKVVLVRGHYVSYLPLCSRNEPVFLAVCTPLAMPETRECVVHGATNVFTTVHAMDMKILHIDANGEWYLGWKKTELTEVSWYQLLHWDSLREAQSKHRLITQSEQDKCCILLVKLQQRSGQFIWVHVVLQVKDAADTPRQFIIATNQILSEEEASIMLTNSWLYQYYGYQNQQCGILDPRCQKFFRRESYQEPYQEPYSYLENPEVEYGYHLSPYVPQKPVEDYNGCERVYTERGPVDYSTHSPQSTISDERSPHHYDPPPEVVVNSSMYMYPHHGKRDYYEQFPRTHYQMQEPCATATIEGTEYPSPKRMRVAPPPLSLLEGTDGMDRWNPSPPWSDTTLKLPEYSQRFTYGHVISMPPERAMVT
ncbi:neuronal PAS domain-containing protein 4-like [Hyposmocoma kahamanoa]|uniref:neuronal PAS domain-containing protein 4-like n=1 Tax=Hyposmocoma kahamanoa TaxID=1477025 RepID=UPI000E6D9250|nr:neuronal PAS domain-containing protein 4-like [Hyposmocoma kahamanoa]